MEHPPCAVNYDHAFHAGNPADVLKHAALSLALGELTRREDPICFADTHAAAGWFNLDDSDGEWSQGIGRLLSRSAQRRMPELAPYLRSIPLEDGRPRRYPGSPALAQALLREGDRLELFELNARDRALLERNLGRDRRLAIHQADGFAGLARLELGDKERLIALIDPPFEADSEWDAIDRAAERVAVKRPGAVMILWFPLKAGAPHEGRPDRLRRSLEDAKVRGVSIELRARGGMLLPRSDRPKIRGALLGSGLIMIGAPSRAIAKLAAVVPELARSLSRPEEGSAWEASWSGWG